MTLSKATVHSGARSKLCGERIAGDFTESQRRRGPATVWLMRVIAGRLGGRKLVAPAGLETRPVTDRVKESIFSSLGPVVSDAVVADLFAGAGSFGIEALSRGARSVVFVERAPKALEALRKNLADLGLTGSEVTVDGATVATFLATNSVVFDVIFCDPPWPLDQVELTPILESLVDRTHQESVVVVTRRASDPVPAPVGFEISDDRRFGDTRIIRYGKDST